MKCSSQIKEERIPSLATSWSPDLLLSLHQLILFLNLVREIEKIKSISIRLISMCIKLHKLLEYRIYFFFISFFFYCLLSYLSCGWVSNSRVYFFFHSFHKSKHEIHFEYFSISFSISLYIGKGEKFLFFNFMQY